jgi:hypothetical protein
MARRLHNGCQRTLSTKTPGKEEEVETVARQPIQTTGPPQNAPARQEIRPTQDLVDYLTNYAREKPEMAALYCLMIGFAVGWKLKFW